MKILIVEDNTQLRDALKFRLELEGSTVDATGAAGEVFHFLEAKEYDIIICDINLPDGDGRELLAKLRRSKFSDVRFIILTARSEVSDRVAGMDMGADDYLVKPVDFTELSARCRAAFRRAPARVDEDIEFEDLRLNSRSFQLFVSDVPVQISPREAKLLGMFLRRPEATFSKTDILDHLYSLDQPAGDNSVEQSVSRLRKAISNSKAKIKTRRGIGYLLSKK